MESMDPWNPTYMESMEYIGIHGTYRNPWNTWNISESMPTHGIYRNPWNTWISISMDSIDIHGYLCFLEAALFAFNGGFVSFLWLTAARNRQNSRFWAPVNHRSTIDIAILWLTAAQNRQNSRFWDPVNHRSTSARVDGVEIGPPLRK